MMNFSLAQSANNSCHGFRAGDVFSIYGEPYTLASVGDDILLISTAGGYAKAPPIRRPHPILWDSVAALSGGVDESRIHYIGRLGITR